jgi:hypothetical protein
MPLTWNGATIAYDYDKTSGNASSTMEFQCKGNQMTTCMKDTDCTAENPEYCCLGIEFSYGGDDVTGLACGWANITNGPLTHGFGY